MPSWCCTSCGVTVSLKVSASAVRDSPTGSSTQTSSSGNSLFFLAQQPPCAGIALPLALWCQMGIVQCQM